MDRSKILKVLIPLQLLTVLKYLSCGLRWKYSKHLSRRKSRHLIEGYITSGLFLVVLVLIHIGLDMKWFIAEFFPQYAQKGGS